MIIAQLFGIFGTIALVFSFQLKKTSYLFVAQMAANAMFIVNYYMLGRFTAGSLLFVSILSNAMILATGGKKKSFMWGFVIVYTLIGIFTYDSIWSALITVAQIASTVSQWSNNGSIIRYVRLGSSPLWMIYNILSHSIGTIIAEGLTALSIIVYLVRTHFNGHTAIDGKKRRGLL